MPACPNCGREAPPDAAFCPTCGAKLLEPERAREERKLVSVLFVDLVGFTSRSDKADPEDVRDTLQGFHARAKLEIERFGGTVEKFIGDAVMAVFGAPVSHGDDAERAVRAGLRVVHAMDDLNRDRSDSPLQVRAAVNTGERRPARPSRWATSSTRPRDCRPPPPSGGSWWVRRRTAPHET
jgi:class 3 adenylate cyclase